MMRRILMLSVLTSAVWAQSNSTNGLKLWVDGAGLALHTESSQANSPLSTSGSVTVGKGDSRRVVLDKQSNPIFAYDIELRKTAQGLVTLRIKPIEQQNTREQPSFPTDKVTAATPTLTATREFPALKVGDSVQVDILHNPGTGETIRDVLRVIDEPPPNWGQAKVAAGNRFSFERVKVVIDGKTVSEPRNSWMIGQAIKMSVPAHGEYYLLLAPTTDFPFQASGWVDRNTLRFKAGNESVEIVGVSNLLQQSETGTVWVYHVPEPRDRAEAREALKKEAAIMRQTYTARHPKLQRVEQLLTALTEVDFHCADNMNQLLGRE
jgi:hypothetical protein